MNNAANVGKLSENCSRAADKYDNKDSETQHFADLSRRRLMATSSSESSTENDISATSCMSGRREFTICRRKLQSRPKAPSVLRAGVLRRMRSSSPISRKRKTLPNLPSDFHEVISKFFHGDSWKLPLKHASEGVASNLENPSRCGIVVGGDIGFGPPMPSKSDLDTTLVVDELANTEGMDSKNTESTQKVVNGSSRKGDHGKPGTTLLSSGCKIMDGDSLPIREQRIEKAHKDLDDKFDSIIRESELYLEELKSILPAGTDLMMDSSSLYTPEGRKIAKKIQEVEEFVSGLQDARKSLVAIYLGQMSLVDTRRPYEEAQLDRIQDLTTLNHLNVELLDLKRGALKQLKNSMVCTLGKLRKEQRDYCNPKSDVENPDECEGTESAPYVAFLIDNCETAARNVILACSDVGWADLTGRRLTNEIRFAQTRASKFHKDMTNWWDQLVEESVEVPAKGLGDTTYYVYFSLFKGTQ